MKKYKIGISIGLILIITFIVFFTTIGNDFLRCWDDYFYVVDNTIIQDLSLKNLQRIFSDFQLGNYHPLTFLSFALEYHFFKLDPRVYHSTNLILHLFNCLLVFWLIFMLTDSIVVSFITGLFFAIHPLRVESVAWISDRKDLLSSFFLLWTVLFYLIYHKKKSIRFFYLSISVFVLSLLSKAMAVTLPFLLLLIDYFQHRKFNKKLLTEKIPFFVIAVVFGIISIFARRSYQGQLQEHLFTFFNKIFISIHRLVFYYLLRMFAPIKLSYLKPYLINNLGLPFTLFLLTSAVILIVLISLVVYSSRRTRKIVFGILFFFITLFPALTVIVLGYSADRFTYLPSIGIFYIWAEFFFWLYHRKSKYTNVVKTFLLIILIGIITTYSFLTRQKCLVWRDCLSLTEYFVKNYPNEPTTYLNRALVYKDKGEYDRAIADYTEALSINPNYIEAYNRRGNAYSYKGEFDKAIADYNRALKMDSEYVEAYYRRGNVYYDKGEYNKAIADYTQALEIDTTHAETYYNRGNAFGRIGEHNKAIADYTQTLMIDPAHIKACYNRAVAYSLMKNYDEAIADFTRVLKINPDYVKVYYNRAVAYFFIKEYEKAWVDVRKFEDSGYQVHTEFLELLQKAKPN